MHFNHAALDLKNNKPLVYTAMSKHLFYYREHISKWVLEQGKVPLNPFMLWDYFLSDSVERNLIREANNIVVKRSDQLYVFGPISNGVLAEIILAQEQQKPIQYFKLKKPHNIIATTVAELEFESDVEQFRDQIISI